MGVSMPWKKDSPPVSSAILERLLCPRLARKKLRPMKPTPRAKMVWMMMPDLCARAMAESRSGLLGKSPRKRSMPSATRSISRRPLVAGQRFIKSITER